MVRRDGHPRETAGELRADLQGLPDQPPTLPGGSQGVLEGDAVASIWARVRERKKACTSRMRPSMVRVGELARCRFMVPQTRSTGL
jgi:hypothetical protein